MLVYGIVICCLPCLIYVLLSQRARPELSGSAIPQVLRSLTRRKFDPSTFTKDEACSICYIDYQEEDDITPLSCDPKHYYHTACIEEWIKKGHNTCPLCRKPIKDASPNGAINRSRDS